MANDGGDERAAKREKANLKDRLVGLEEEGGPRARSAGDLPRLRLPPLWRKDAPE